MDAGKNAVSFELPPVIDISVANDLHRKLKDFPLTEEAEVDASKVEKITTAGVQLLISFSFSLQKNKAAMFIVNPSEKFITAFEDLGFSSQLIEWEGKK